MKFMLLFVVAFSVCVQAQAPILTGLSPNSVAAGSNSASVTLTGAGFSPNCTVRCGARVLAVNYVNATSLQVALPASDLTSGHTLLLRVERPLFGISGALPLRVTGESLASGAWHCVALTSTAKASVWGSNFSGQLGNGTFLTSGYPLRLSATGVAAASAGQGHTLLVNNDGTLRAAGYNASGQLGMGDTTTRGTLAAVPGISNAIAVAAGGYHTVILLADGTVRTCGENGSGQLGLGDTTDRTSFTPVAGLSSVVAICAGESHSLALLADGSVRAWGLNSNGQLGLGDTSMRTSPTAINTLSNVVALAAGGWHSLLLVATSAVWSCGANLSGQLGLGDNTDRMTPASTSATNVSTIAAGGYHSVILSAGGTIQSCGDNTSGQLGLGDNLTRTSFSVVPLLTARALAAGTAHSLFLGPWGLVYASGSNTYGQLGDNSFVNSNFPVQVAYLDLTPVTLALSAQLPSTFTIATNGAIEHAGHVYLNAFSADPLNATQPYLGQWFGLFLAYDDLLFFVNTPPFVGVLNAVGVSSAALTLPLPTLTGLQIFGVSTVWDLNAGIYTGYSAIATHTF